MKKVSALLAALTLTFAAASAQAAVPWATYTNYDRPGNAVMVAWGTLAELKKAQALEKAGKTVKALELYDKTFYNDPMPVVQAELGFAYLRAGDYVQGCRHLSWVIAMEAVSRTMHSQDEIADALNLARQEVGGLFINANVDAKVDVDNNYTVDWVLNREIFVLPGEHKITATKPGYWSEDLTVNVAKGERLPVRISMHPQPGTHIFGIPRAVNLNIKNEVPASSPPKDAPWVEPVMMIGGTGMCLGIAALIMGLSQQRGTTNQREIETWTVVASTGGMVAGLSLIGVVVGAVKLANRPTPVPNITIMPTVGLQSGVLQLHGTF